MFQNNMGKLLMYATSGVPQRKRLQSVKIAAEETAKRLNLDFEIIKSDKDVSSIYVYYDSCDNCEPIPLYCDIGKAGDLADICIALRKMIFVLSFHPKHSALKQLRSEIMRLS